MPNFPDYPFQPRRLEVRPGIAMSFLDEGPRDGEVVVMLHGNPSWSYYWRHLVAGLADRYRTVSDFLITPVVAVVPPDLPLRPAEVEVAAIFEAPLGFVTDPANQRFTTVEWRGRPRPYYQIDWGGRRIWGATAAMIVNLSRRLAWS